MQSWQQQSQRPTQANTRSRCIQTFLEANHPLVSFLFPFSLPPPFPPLSMLSTTETKEGINIGNGGGAEAKRVEGSARKQTLVEFGSGWVGDLLSSVCNLIVNLLYPNLKPVVDLRSSSSKPRCGLSLVSSYSLGVKDIATFSLNTTS